MKKVRLTAIAAVLAISAVAVSRANMQKADDPAEWQLKTGQDPNIASSYELVTDPSAVDCDQGPSICTIIDVPDQTTQTQPALTFGDVTTHQTDYQATTRSQE